MKLPIDYLTGMKKEIYGNQKFNFVFNEDVNPTGFENELPVPEEAQASVMCVAPLFFRDMKSLSDSGREILREGNVKRYLHEIYLISHLLPSNFQEVYQRFIQLSDRDALHALKHLAHMQPLHVTNHEMSEHRMMRIAADAALVVAYGRNPDARWDDAIDGESQYYAAIGVPFVKMCVHMGLDPFHLMHQYPVVSFIGRMRNFESAYILMLIFTPLVTGKLPSLDYGKGQLFG